jgi:predicted PurR-regulated permease PerM
VVLFVLAFFAVIKLSSGAVVPILVALATAYVFAPAVDWLARRGMSRTLAVLALFFAIALGMAGALVYLVPAIREEMAKLPEFVRAIAQKAIPRIETLIGRPLPQNIRDAASELSQEGGGFAEKTLPSLARVAVGALSSTASMLIFAFGLLVVPVLAFHLLRDYDRIVSWFRSLIPRRYESLIAGRFGEVNAVLGGFIRGQLTVGAILTCLYGLGLSLSEIDLAVVIGAIAGFGTMIPYIGPGIGMMLATLSLVVSWEGPWQVGAVAGTFALAMTIEGLFITPRIVGGKVGLSAVMVMISVLVFGDLFGFAGVLLAVPVTAALKVVAQVVLQRYRRTGLYKGP